MSKRNRGKKRNAKSPKRAVEKSQDAWRYGRAMETAEEALRRAKQERRMERLREEAVRQVR